MKNVIRSVTLLIGLSTGLVACAAENLKLEPPSKIDIHFSPLPFNAGIEINTQTKPGGKISVIILDEDATVFLKEVLKPGTQLKRDYILNRLDDGEYTIIVTANKQVAQKEVQIHDHGCHLL